MTKEYPVIQQSSKKTPPVAEMSAVKKRSYVRPEKLRASLDPQKIPYQTSDEIPNNGIRLTLQKRVMQALEMGLHITAGGYNIFLAGESDLGRRYLLREYLTPRAKGIPAPPDLVFINNFADVDAPLLLTLPAGAGKKVKKTLAESIAKLQKGVHARLAHVSVTNKRSSLFYQFQEQRDKLYNQMSDMAVGQGFSFSMDEGGGMTLFPVADGKRLNEQELEALGTEEREKLKKKGDTLLKPMSGLIRKLTQAEQSFRKEERNLERSTVSDVIESVFDPSIAKLQKQIPDAALATFLSALRADILENYSYFAQLEYSVQPSTGNSFQSQAGIMAPQSSSTSLAASLQSSLETLNAEEIAARYDVNVFVDNSELSGAPLIFEDHPTITNLMGVIERESEMGALVTNFSLIKAGSLHRANGGFLVLQAEDLLQHQGAWEALIRSLRSGVSRIEDSFEEDAAKTKSLHPPCIPLSLKVILVGSEEMYDYLLENDERFSKLFKIKAHMVDVTPRNAQAVKVYLSHFKKIITADNLLPFTKEALARLVDYGSLLIEDQNKLSLKFPLIREVMVEASAIAAMKSKAQVTEHLLEEALEARQFRSNLIEEEFMEEYDRHIIKVATSGEAIGRVNGLAVLSYGDFEFGLPHQISCTIGAGNGGIIDLERDAQLGGPIHTKAMMILKTYLIGAFAHNKPLILTGSLGFEQNYYGIEGDSASGAELAALLSALANVPVNLSFAFTGAVSQSGDILAVGGVTRKIEGFFEVCKRHGLTGEQGVILPHVNLAHLMLKKEVIEAVMKNQFHIYSVTHIQEALEILTGIPSGKLRKDGTYTAGSLFDRVDRRLKELAKVSTVQPKKSGTTKVL